MAGEGSGLTPDGEPRRLGGPGFEIVERVRASIARRGMLSGGESVLVAVSGGPDSMCLLDVLARLADPLDLTLAVAHVDHGLSDVSQAIAAHVAAHGATAGFEVHVARAPQDLAGPNLQARARDFRYAFFAAIAEREGASAIATGHTLDDRVETTLARLIHGGTTDVVAGLAPADRPRIRPLIDVRRAEARAYCDELGLTYFDDPANENDAFERVAVRTRLVGAIEERWGPGAIRAIARSIDRLAEDSEVLRKAADVAYESAVSSEGDRVSFPMDEMLGLPRAIRRRVLEAMVGRVRDRHGGIDAALDALDDGKTGVRFAVARGAEISLAADAVSVSRMLAGEDTDGLEETDGPEEEES